MTWHSITFTTPVLGRGWKRTTRHWRDKAGVTTCIQYDYVRTHVGRVPRALVDVQRRGGRGTP